MDFYHESLVHINDFELHDFIEDHQIRGEKEDTFCNVNSDLMNGYFVDNPSFLPFDQCNSNSVNVCDSLSSFSCFDGDATEGGEENDGDNSSATTTTTTTTSATTSIKTKPRSKTDRSMTLISERRRRGRMKEKLYALRSLVPYITKMDKASIIGDAVSYVYDLQSQAKKLKTEVAGLEASLLVPENPIKVQFLNNNSPSICKKIFQMDMFQVDERGFYVKIVCNRGEGVAASLYRSLESLRSFNVQNSNLATVSDSFILTFSLNVKGCEPEFDLPSLKLRVTGAFLNQGFDFIPSFQA